MQLKQLVTSARQYLQDNGYAASTIYHNYAWHWNTFLKSVGDSEYSYGLLTGYVIPRKLCAPTIRLWNNTSNGYAG